jgi:phosphoribosylaminoimidazolecarboxamide formyltransferase/IMP cyclohydrolase
MNQSKTPIKRALISVSDKQGIIELARGLTELNIEIISTGGTSQLLREAGIIVRDVSDLTQFPEMMNGRVKTLHPTIHGGILGLRDEHASVASQHQIEWIDLVIVNLYPFAATVKNHHTWDEAIENIDIGGPTLIRAGAKNMGWVSVIVDPQDYVDVLTELKNENGLSYARRLQLATKAFSHVADYDAMICEYLQSSAQPKPSIELFPADIHLHLKKYADLRYGENPHQAASAYYFSEQPRGILFAKQRQGKQLSYNNIADADAAIHCVREFTRPACVIVKHANPCGVAVADDIHQAFERAFYADSVSAFGGIIALNRPCDKKTAEAIWQIFTEVVIAPSFTADALAVLSTKPNLRLLELDFSALETETCEYKLIDGGFLIQEKDRSIVHAAELKVVTKIHPSDQDMESMLFAWQVLKHIKSNAILLAKTDCTVGIGAGQVSRIDAVDIALRKADHNVSDTVLASDAFFPFRDSIDRIANTGIRAVIQPGGALKDNEVIQACDEHGIAMVFTGKRCFKH